MHFLPNYDESLLSFHQDGFIKVRKRDLERLTTEVMQLGEFLPRVLTGDLTETLRRALTTLTRESPRIVLSCCAVRSIMLKHDQH